MKPIRNCTPKECSKAINFNVHRLSFEELVNAVNRCDESELDSDKIHVAYSVISKIMCDDYFLPLKDKNSVYLMLYGEASLALTRLNSMFTRRMILSGF